MCISLWTYRQSAYNDKISKYFSEKTITGFERLKDVANLTDKKVLLKGSIASGETFKSKDGTDVVLERYKEEEKDRNPAKGWKLIKGSVIFKVIPFNLKENSNKILIDPFGLDKTFLGNPETKKEIVNGQELLKSTWKFVPGQTLYILGNIENKAGQLIVNNPDFNNSFFTSLWNKEPFIITTMYPSEVSEKARDMAKSVYFASLALAAVGVFFIITGINNIFKKLNSKADNH